MVSVELHILAVGNCRGKILTIYTCSIGAIGKWHVDTLIKKFIFQTIFAPPGNSVRKQAYISQFDIQLFKIKYL